MSVKDAAGLAGLSPASIYHAINRGELEAVRLCSRYRIRRSAFDEWIERARVVRRIRSSRRRRGRCRSRISRAASATCCALLAGFVMSVERVVRGDGSVVWRVRWRQAGQNRAKVLGRKRDAEAFDAELRRRKRLGELALLDAGKQPLREFGKEWWRLYAEPNLARATLELYAMLWDTHILPRLGSVRCAS